MIFVSNQIDLTRIRVEEDLGNLLSQRLNEFSDVL